MSSYRKQYPAPDRRRSELAAIHVAKAQLAQHGMDDDSYRAMLFRVSAAHGAPCHSAADLDARQRAAVIDEMRRLGAAKPRKGGATRAGEFPGRPHNADTTDTALMVSKIEALLTDMKLAWVYADAIAKRMFGVSRVAWVRDHAKLSAIIAALWVEQEKRRISDDIDWCLQELKWDPERIVALLGPLRPNWRRHRNSLRLVRRFLREQLNLPAADEVLP